ncbi:hypothetical protein, conserved in T. vivax [Trypanosoma vivax Y486]|uniref:Uncharacterized protein n=1 Tax=Trypanosoma vivax (strain Y486) TaxID=1055687 RepID=F9WSU0_TRYVY|nr:hypothetical protein, conserved in T. vivax [Trypanosoma vivax Y486]|eukprot:CCD20629.1 hypothetical protein, conserved in T. vivax [Trypanosoma vivax Y486]
MEDAVRVIERVNASIIAAGKAEDAAKNSEKTATNGFSFISLVVRGILRINDPSFNTFEGTREMVEKICIDGGKCHEAYNVSNTLGTYAARLNRVVNLTEWKDNMLALLNSTYYKIQLNTSTCQWTFGGNEKKANLESAVRSDVDQPVISVQHFNVAHAAVLKAQEGVQNVTNGAETVRGPVVASLKRNGAALCDMLARRASLWERISASGKQLNEERKGVSGAVGTVQKVQSSVIATKRLLEDVRRHVTAVLPDCTMSDARTTVEKSIISATKRVSMDDAGVRSVLKWLGEANSSTIMTEQAITKGSKTLERLSKQLGTRLSEFQLNSAASVDECKERFEALSSSMSVGALGHAVKLDAGALFVINGSLQELEKQTADIREAVVGISRKTGESLNSAASSVRCEHEALSVAGVVFSEILKSLLSILCVTVTELHELNGNFTFLVGRSANLKTNVTVERARAVALLKGAGDASDTPQYVEEGFVVAARRATLLDIFIRRAGAQLKRILVEFSAQAPLKVKSNTFKVHAIVKDHVTRISRAVSNPFYSNVCDQNTITELVLSLKANSDDILLLNNVDVITELRQFVKNIGGRVTRAQQLVERVLVAAAEAEVALDEAMRGAREASASRRCTPLYRQLWGQVGRAW